MPETAADKNEKLAIELGFLKGLTSDAKDVLVWVLKAAASNPLLGFMGGLIVLDMLHQSKVISDIAYAAGMVALGAFDAVAVASAVKELTAGTTSVGWGLFNASSSPPSWDLFAPSGQTITYADSSAQEVHESTPQAGIEKVKSLLPLLGGLKALPPPV